MSIGPRLIFLGLLLGVRLQGWWANNPAGSNRHVVKEDEVSNVPLTSDEPKTDGYRHGYKILPAGRAGSGSSAPHTLANLTANLAGVYLANARNGPYRPHLV